MPALLLLITPRPLSLMRPRPLSLMRSMVFWPRPTSQAASVPRMASTMPRWAETAGLAEAAATAGFFDGAVERTFVPVPGVSEQAVTARVNAVRAQNRIRTVLSLLHHA